MSTENKSVCSCGAACDAKALKASVKKLTSDNAKLSKQLASAQAKASKASATAATKLQKANDKVAKLQATVTALKAAAKASAKKATK